MTHKEKAKELVEKYLKKIGPYHAETKTKELAKQSALICVDEVLESLWNTGHSFSNDEIKYWQEVKQEINKINR